MNLLTDTACFVCYSR